jgi:hypothetical protein
MAFEYKPFINPYIGSISELMGKGDQAKAEALLRIGEIQARAAEQQGQAWGNAIQGLGNIASKTITDYNSPEAQDRRAAEKAKAIFNDMGKAETQTTQGLAYRNFPGNKAVPAELTRSELSLDSPGNFKVGADGKFVRTEVPGAAAIAGTLPSRQGFPTIARTNPYRVLAESGVKNLDTWDIDAASKNFAKNNVPPELAFKYTQMMRTSNADMEEHHEKAMSIMRKNSSDILQLSPDARLGAAQQLLQKYQNNGVLSYKDLQSARQQLDSIAALPVPQQAVATSKFLLGLSGEKPTIVTTGVGQTSRVLQTNEVVDEGPSPKSASPQSTSKLVRITWPDGTTTDRTAEYVPGQGKGGQYFVNGQDITSLNPQLIDDPSLLELALGVAANKDPDGVNARAIAMVQPLVQVTDSTGRPSFLPRSVAASAKPKLLPEEQSRVNGLQKMLGSIDKILAMADDPDVWADAKKGVGSFGRGYFQSALSKTLGIGTKNQQTLRDFISAVRANSSFESGGKALTKTELDLVDAFTGNIDIDPDVSVQMLRDRRGEFVDALSVYGVNPRLNNATPKAGGNDSYAAYLARQEAKSNAR